MNRGSRHQKIYQDDSDYQFFLILLSSIKEKLHFFLHAYCLMTNHYHLLIETNEAEMWKIMKPLNQYYTEYYNHKYGYDGPLFRLDEESLKLLKETCDTYGYSARVIHKMLRLSRTSADLDGAENIRLEDIRKVIGCRDLDRSNSQMLVVK